MQHHRYGNARDAQEARDVVVGVSLEIAEGEDLGVPRIESREGAPELRADLRALMHPLRAVGGVLGQEPLDRVESDGVRPLARTKHVEGRIDGRAIEVAPEVLGGQAGFLPAREAQKDRLEDVLGILRAPGDPVGCPEDPGLVLDVELLETEGLLGSLAGRGLQFALLIK